MQELRQPAACSSLSQQIRGKIIPPPIYVSPRTRFSARFRGWPPCFVRSSPSVTAVCWLFDKSDPKLLRQEPCKGAETDSRAKFGKEIIAEVDRRPKWVPHYGAQADSGSAQALLRLCSGSAQALLRLCSGSAQALLRLCSGSLRLAQALLRHAHPRLRYAHPQLRLKQQLLTSTD
jgi:hypothetical protein